MYRLLALLALAVSSVGCSACGGGPGCCGLFGGWGRKWLWGHCCDECGCGCEPYGAAAATAAVAITVVVTAAAATADTVTMAAAATVAASRAVAASPPVAAAAAAAMGAAGPASKTCSAIVRFARTLQLPSLPPRPGRVWLPGGLRRRTWLRLRLQRVRQLRLRQWLLALRRLWQRCDCGNGCCPGNCCETYSGCCCQPQGPGCCASGDHHYNFDPGPPVGQVAYPYYTVHGPRDFLQKNPPRSAPIDRARLGLA